MADAHAADTPFAPAPATLRAYRADWAHYIAWCERAGAPPLPADPHAVAAYLATLTRSHAPATIRRRLAALGRVHRYNDLPWSTDDPAILALLRGLPARPAATAPLSQEQLQRLAAACDTGARGLRDRAMLLLGFAAALRRAELVALLAEDVTAVAGGLTLRLRHRRPGRDCMIMVPRGAVAETCPVGALAAWQALARRQAGPLFRRVDASGRIGDAPLHPDAVRRILAHRCAVAGVAGNAPPTHALRAGGLASAAPRRVRLAAP
jgi:site-specific recombinase XerD